MLFIATKCEFLPCWCLVYDDIVDFRGVVYWLVGCRVVLIWGRYECLLCSTRELYDHGTSIGVIHECIAWVIPSLFRLCTCRLSEKENSCKDLESKVTSLNEQLNNLTKDVESQRQKNDVSTTHARRVTLNVLGHVYTILHSSIVCLCVLCTLSPFLTSNCIFIITN